MSFFENCFTDTQQWAALICASTVFTKQHSIIDVVCGLALAAVWGVILYGPWKKRQD